MKLSLNWLRDYADLDAPAGELSHAITFLGFEVEGVAVTGAPRLDHVVVGEVRARDKHPNADKLSVCQVDVGPAGGVKTIVCGAQNYAVGDRVPVALPGAVLPGNFTIRQSKIRGQLSDGMMCSGRELGIGDDHQGLLILAGRPEIGLPINQVLPAGDTVFDVEITPNRPDCLSHLGMARELAAWFRKPLRYPEVRFSGHHAAGGQAPGDGARPVLHSVRVDAPGDCPLYIAHAVCGVKIGPSPAWLQERLRSVGLRPVNNVVDVGNYVMLEYGQPLHAFDAAKLGGGRIIVRRAAAGEKIVTLDGREHTLGAGMLVIADESRPVVVAGIMGGVNSGVDEGTTDLVLECAVFNPMSVRRTSRSLGLSSDSSYRYERGVDSEAAGEAARRAIDLILQTAGGSVTGPVHTVGSDTPVRREIVLSTRFVAARLGFEIPEPDMRRALEALELDISREASAPGGGQEWTVSIPSWRGDLDRPIDLVEEILRLHGTDKIPPSLVAAPGLVGEDDPVVRFNRAATAYLVGHDFHECVNTTLRSAQETATWVSETAAQELVLSNPFADDQSHLRPTLVMGLLETLRLNQSRGVAASRLCETGRIFIERNGQNYECAAAAFLIAEDASRPWRRREPADFYTAKHHVEALAAAAGVALAREPLLPAAGPYFGWQEGHAAQAGDMAQGWTARFGLLNVGMVRALGIAGTVYGGIFSILPEKLPAVTARRRYSDFSLYPAALRDLALVVDAAIPAAEVREAVARAGRAAPAGAFGLESVGIFDVYQGQGLPEGRKSLAFSLVFRAADRTLTDDEVNAAFNRLQEDIARSTPYQIRK
jgi:phenylalanyl-tRNA synthetase beta chain